MFRTPGAPRLALLSLGLSLGLSACGGNAKDAELGDVAEVELSAVSATTLRLDRPLDNLSGAASSARYFAIAVPSGAARLVIELEGAEGDADIYLRYNRYPSTSRYDARSDGATSSERIEVRAPRRGTWYVMLRGYSAFRGARIVATTGASSPAPSPTASPAPIPPPPPASSPTEALEVEVLELVNQARARGAVCDGVAMPAVAALTMNAELRAAARGHSVDMATQNYFSHVGRDGRSFAQRIVDSGFSGGFPRAENIAAGRGTAAGVMDQWMNSGGHCRNIMGADFRTLGVGFAESAASTYRYYWTQNFGG